MIECESLYNYQYFGLIEFPENEKDYMCLNELNSNIDKCYEEIYNLPVNAFVSLNYTCDLILYIYISYIYINKDKIGEIGNLFLLITITMNLIQNVNNFNYSISYYSRSISEFNEFWTYCKTNIYSKEEYIQSEPIIFPWKINVEIPIPKNMKNSDKKIILQGDINIEYKDFIFLIGRKGSGKTTLAEEIAGYQNNILNKANKRDHILYVSQEYKKTLISSDDHCFRHFFPDMDIEKMKEILLFYDFPVEEKMFNIDSMNDLITKMGKMSGGEEKSFYYCSLLYKFLNKDNNKYQILILDEPHKDLDQESYIKMYQGIRYLYPNLSIIIIMHECPVKYFPNCKIWSINQQGEIKSSKI